MSIPFHELLLAESQLSYQHAVALKARVDDLKRFLACPGDWGYDSMLGRLTIALGNVQIAAAQRIQEIKEAHPGL